MKPKNGDYRVARVCFISSFPPSRGRLSEYAFNLVCELHKCPFIEHIDILANPFAYGKYKQLNNKTTVHATWEPDNPVSILKIPFEILRIKPDIVHFNVHMAVYGHSRIANFLGLCLPVLSRLLGFKTITTLHNLTESINLEKVGFKNSLINRTFAFIATKLVASATTVTLTAKSHMEIFRNRYKSKNVVRIPHGTWKNQFNNHHNKKKYKTILYFGHSGPYKDIELVLDSFKITNKRRKNTRLIIAGISHPNYPGYLEKYRFENNSNNISYRGYIPEGKLASLFEEADVVILPYYTCTGTSGVAHLASSFGTPIIATELPEIRELVNEGCGVLLSPHDSIALSKRIENVLDNTALAKKLREQNFRFAEKRLWSIVASSFCELYKEILSDKRRATPDLDLKPAQ